MKTLKKWLAAIVVGLLFPALALAQVAPAPVPPPELPGGDRLWEFAAGILAMIALAVFRALWKERSAEREKFMAWGIHVAYHAVNEISLMTENTVDDKVARALGFLDEALKSKGLPPASEAEQAAAQLAWKAMHGSEKRAERLAELSSP